jgi:MFS family permease
MPNVKGVVMPSSNLVRLSGLAAILGGVLGIVLTPILSYLWATYSDAYEYYGKAYFLVFLGFLVGLAGLYARRKRSPERLEEENWGFGLTFFGLTLGLMGDVLEYWGGDPAKTSLRCKFEDSVSRS